MENYETCPTADTPYNPTEGLGECHRTEDRQQQLEEVLISAEEMLKGSFVDKNPKYIEAQKRGKVDYSTIPWNVIGLLAQAMMEGAGKYGRFNYYEDEIEARTYIAAICRHLFGDPSTGSKGWVNGEDIDEESGLPHLIKIMACCLLVEASKQHGTLIDNRMETESKKEAPQPTPFKEIVWEAGVKPDLRDGDVFELTWLGGRKDRRHVRGTHVYSDGGSHTGDVDHNVYKEQHITLVDRKA